MNNNVMLINLVVNAAVIYGEKRGHYCFFEDTINDKNV